MAADVAEVVWSDNPGGVRVEGKVSAGGGGLLELLAEAAKTSRAAEPEPEAESPSPRPRKAAKAAPRAAQGG